MKKLLDLLKEDDERRFDSAEFVEDDPDEPDEEDIIIKNEGPLGGYTAAYCCGKQIASCGGQEGREECERKVKEWMDKEKYWPNVWYQSDHGNMHLIKDLGK